LYFVLAVVGGGVPIFLRILEQGAVNTESIKTFWIDIKKIAFEFFTGTDFSACSPPLLEAYSGFCVKFHDLL